MQYNLVIMDQVGDVLDVTSLDFHYGTAKRKLMGEGVFKPDEEPSFEDLAYHMVRCGFIPVPENRLWEIRDSKDKLVATNWG